MSKQVSISTYVVIAIEDVIPATLVFITPLFHRMSTTTHVTVTIEMFMTTHVTVTIEMLMTTHVTVTMEMFMSTHVTRTGVCTTAHITTGR